MKSQRSFLTQLFKETGIQRESCRLPGGTEKAFGSGPSWDQVPPSLIHRDIVAMEFTQMSNGLYSQWWGGGAVRPKVLLASHSFVPSRSLILLTYYPQRNHGN